MGQSFAEDMGFAERPWVMVRHGQDHVHLVVFRVSDTGEVWHGRNDRRAAQSACTKLEREHGLEQAPRRRVQPKLAVTAEREEFKGKARTLGSHRAAKEAERRELEEQRSKIQKMRDARCEMRDARCELPEPTHDPRAGQGYTVRAPAHCPRTEARPGYGNGTLVAKQTMIISSVYNGSRLEYEHEQ